VPTTFEQMGANAIAFIKALALKQVDVLGFSIGGSARHFRCGPAVANSGVASYICSLNIGLDFSIRQPERKVPDISLGRFEGGRRARDRVTG
jgi:hypothetical protein